MSDKPQTRRSAQRGRRNRNNQTAAAVTAYHRDRTVIPGRAGGTLHSAASGNQYTITTGPEGSTEKIVADTNNTTLARTITGSQIAGVSITLIETGTTTADLALSSVEGEGVTYDATANTVTVGGKTYSISKTSADNYSAAGNAADFEYETGLTVTETTYTFSNPLGEGDITVTIGTDGKVYNGTEEQGNIEVIGATTYTFNVSGQSVSATGTYTIGDDTYTTTISGITLTPGDSVLSAVINGETFSDIDDSWTYTTSYGGSTYNYTYNAETGVIDVVTGTPAVVYSVNENDDETAYIVTLEDGSAPVADAIYTFTLGGQTFTTVGANVSSVIANSGIEIGEEGLNISLSSTSTMSAETSVTEGYSYLTNVTTGTTVAIVDNSAEVMGVTLTFTNEGGTYTSVSAEGREVSDFTGDSFVLEGGEATLASRDEDGVWQIAEGVDNITNSSDEPLQFVSADGDTGTLAPGASYNSSENSLTNAGEGSIIKNEDGYATSDGDVTGLNEDGSVSYDDAGNLVIEGANEGTAVNGETLGVTGDDDFNATLPAGGGNASVSGISDGASVDLSKIDGIEAEEGAVVGLTGEGSANINGEDVSVSGDEDGVSVTAAAEGISAMSGVSNGAAVTVPEGTAVSTDEDGSVGSVGVNGVTFSTTDPDGLTITPTEDGYAVSGLNGDSSGDAFLTADSEATVTIGDDTYSVGPNASIKASADGTASSYTSNDKAFDDEIANNEAFQDLEVVNIADAAKTVDENGNEVIDLSASPASAIRVKEDYDGTPIIMPTVGGSLVQLDSDFEGEVALTGSDNGDTFINLGEGTMNATPGSGADSIVSGPNDNIDLSAGGKDTINAANGGTFNGYDPLADEAPAFLVNGADDQDAIQDAIKAGTLALTDNGLGNAVLSDLDDSDDRTLANLIGADGEEVLYAWTGSDGGELTSEGIEKSAVYVGNAAGGKSATTIDTDNDYEDTILAGAGDSVSAGNGDTVDLSDNGSDSADGPVMVDDGSKRKNIGIKNFHGGFGKRAPKFAMGEPKFDRISFVDGILSLIRGALTFALEGWSSNSAAYAEKFDDEDGLDVTAIDGTTTTTSDATTSVADASNPGSGVLEFQTIDEDGETTNNVAIASNKEYMVDAEYAGTELSFQGESVSSGVNGSTVNFGNISDDVAVDLSGNFLNDTYEFDKISDIKGGAGNTTLVGGSKAVGLHAGSGESTIFGGTGADSLYSYDGESSGESTFFYTAGNGADSIKSFDFGAGDTNDVINFSNTGLEQAAFSGNALKITVEGGDVLTIEDAKNNIIKAEAAAQNWSGAVEFGDDLTYDAGVGMYGNYAEENNKLTVSDSNLSSDEASEGFALYMNGKDEYGKAYDENYYYNVNNIDASGVSANASIAGGDYENDSIVGGSGSNSLWGGLGGDDTLVGGSGQNTFFYLLGDGNDVITNAKSGDTIELWNTSIDDIDLSGTYENSSTSAISVKFNNGDSLTVTAASGNSLGNVGFKIGNDTWKINSDRTWRNSGDDESSSN